MAQISQQESAGIYGTEPLFYIGLLTDEQKKAGYFVAQDDDSIHIFHKGQNDNARCVAVLLYETATVKEIREITKKDMVTKNAS